MNQDLRVVLDREKAGADGSFTLVAETDLVDSGFVVGHLLVQRLNQGGCACLVAVSRTLHHYQEVGRKLGVDVKAQVDSGQLVVVECIKRQFESLGRKDTTTNGGPGDLDLRVLYEEVRTAVLKFEQQPFTIVVDDLAAWLCVGVTHGDVVAFVQNCQRLAQGDGGQQGALVAVTAVDSNGQDGELNRLERHLAHMADSRIAVRELATGYSKDVHGELSFTRYNRLLISDLPAVTTTKLHFKIEDKRVLTFPLGTSTAVL